MDNSDHVTDYILFLVLFGVAIHDTSEALELKTSLGSNVTLPCNSNSDYPQWHGPDVNPYNYFSSSVFNPNLGEKLSRLSWQNRRNLMISNVTRGDAGNYTCYLVGQSSQTVQLTVRVKPSTIDISTAVASVSNGLIVKGSEGSSLNLTCVSSGGYPEQMLHWYRESTATQPLPSSENRVVLNVSSNTFTITHVVYFIPTASDDNISYICQSSFTDEPKLLVEKSARMFLNLKPDVPTVTQPGTIIEGDNKSIARCTTGGFRPANSFNLTWIYRGTTAYYTGSPVPSGTTYSVAAEFQRSVTKTDNVQQLTCSVRHLTLNSPLSATMNITVQFQPESVTISGNQTVVANGTNPLRIICTTSSSNPASSIVWKKGSVILSNNAQYTSIAGEYNGVIRSQTLILYPTRDMDGDVISCEGSNTVSVTAVRNSISLDLMFYPVIDVVPPQTVVEGNFSLLECSASSKPWSTFRWYRQDQQKALVQGIGFANSNRLVYNITSVKRTDAGVYRCTADNGLDYTDNKTTVLTVLYPPDVVVEGSNTSVQASSAQLTCRANGVPNDYRYGGWIHEWPGYGIVSRRPSGQTLNIFNLTYEHSGIYTCSASNGIQLFGTKHEYMEGSLYLQVRSFPIQAYTNNSTPDILTVFGKTQSWTSVQVDFYSRTKLSNVSCFRVFSDTKRSMADCSSAIHNATVHIKVFSHIVAVPGFRIFVTIYIESEEDFGMYLLEVANEIGASVKEVNVLVEGAPAAPYNIHIDSVQQTSVILSWQPSLHGGFDQTVVIQISTDRISWINKTALSLGQKIQRTTVTLLDLYSSRSYFLRMFSFNIRGKSNLTQIFNFTTVDKEEAEVSSSNILIGGITGGVAGVVFFVAIVLIMVYIKRRRFIRKDNKELEGMTESSPQYESLEERPQRNQVAEYSSLSEDNKELEDTTGRSPQYESLEGRPQRNQVAEYSSLSEQVQLEESPANYYNAPSSKPYQNQQTSQT